MRPTASSVERPIAFDSGKPLIVAAIAASLRERSRTLVEMAEQAAFYLKAPEAYDPQSTASSPHGHNGRSIELQNHSFQNYTFVNYGPAQRRPHDVEA